MAKYTALFEIKLTETNPAPPLNYAFTFEADETKPNADTLLKTSYKAGEKKMIGIFKKYTYFNRLSISQDMSHKIVINGSTISDIVGGVGDELEVA